MKNLSSLVPVFLAIAALTACGKVADPLPPVIRIPEPVSDFVVAQVGYQLRFGWTNPSRNIDLTPSSELTRAVIRSDGEVVLEVPVSVPGQAQTAELDAQSLIGSSRSFAIEIGTASDRLSASSASVRIVVMDVPGPVDGLRATVDQEQISLEWALPSEGRELIDSMRVYRSAQLLVELEGEVTGFEDRDYIADATYTYVVSGVRSLPDSTLLEGVRSVQLEVEARDEVPPAAPVGLGLRSLDGGAFLTWEAGPETDIAGYRILRREEARAEFLPLNEAILVVTGYNDPEYVPGFAYTVSARDRSGNESPPSGVVQ